MSRKLDGSSSVDHEQRRKRRPCQITMSAWTAQAPILGETVGEIPMPLMVQLVDGKMARMVTIDREAADEAIAGDARRMMRASFYFLFLSCAMCDACSGHLLP